MNEVMATKNFYQRYLQNISRKNLRYSEVIATSLFDEKIRATTYLHKLYIMATYEMNMNLYSLLKEEFG